MTDVDRAKLLALFGRTAGDLADVLGRIVGAAAAGDDRALRCVAQAVLAASDEVAGAEGPVRTLAAEVEGEGWRGAARAEEVAVDQRQVDALRAEFREAMREQAAQTRELIMLALGRPAQATGALAGLALHIDRADFHPAEGQPQQFHLAAGAVLPQERNEAVDQAATRALERVGNAVAALADRPPPIAPPLPGITFAPRFEVPAGAIRLEAELKVPPRKTEITMPDGRKATSETRDA